MNKHLSEDSMRWQDVFLQEIALMFWTQDGLIFEEATAMILSTLEMIATTAVYKTCSNKFATEDRRTFPVTYHTFLLDKKMLQELIITYDTRESWGKQIVADLGLNLFPQYFAKCPPCW